MNKNIIKVGMKLKIVGNKGGCPPTLKCIDCGDFKKGIIVTKIRGSGENGRCINAESIIENNHSWGPSRDHCSFHPDDLEPFVMSWRERYSVAVKK